jgi:hypothetical protein
MERIVIGMVLGAAVFSGCSFGYDAQCRQLQNQGKIQATLSSCTECASQFGLGNTEMINGCALGLDASKLMGNKPKQ